jgi:hypothetical protein
MRRPLPVFQFKSFLTECATILMMRKDLSILANTLPDTSVDRYSVSTFQCRAVMTLQCFTAPVARHLGGMAPWRHHSATS